MKIGTLIFLLILLLITLGYVIADDLQTRERLNEVNGKIDELTAQVEQLRADLNTCTGQVTSAQEEIDRRDLTIRELSAQIETLEAQIHSLEFEGTILQAKQATADLLGSNPVVLAGVLIYEVFSSVVKRRQEAGHRFLLQTQARKGRQVRLSEQELAEVIRGRRARR